MFNPKGSIVRRAITQVVDDETGESCRVAGSAIMVYIHANANAYNRLMRWGQRSNALITPVSSASEGDGTFNRKTGERRKGDGEKTNVFQVTAEPDVLAELTTREDVVREWHFILSIRIPVTAAGNSGDSDKGKAALRFARSPKAEKLAVLAREDFARMTAAEKTAFRVQEAQDVPPTVQAI